MGGEEPSDSPPQTSLQGTTHTRQPDGTLDIYEAVTEAYDNDPWFQSEKHTASYIFRNGAWSTQRNQLKKSKEKTPLVVVTQPA